MNKLLILACACFAAESVLALPDYEPFADATGSGGTSYTVGANLIGQTNAAGQAWYQAGPASATQPTIASGDLTISGLASSGGGRSAAFGGNGESARFDLSVGSGGITSGTVYFSFALQMTSLASLNTAGTYFAGFNVSQGTSTSTPGTVGVEVQARKTTGGYNIGLQENNTGGTLVWSPTVFTTSDVLFLVGSYTFNPSTGDDVAQLWVDPSSSTFGVTNAPGGSLVSSGAPTDSARVASFMLFDHASNEPSGEIDDLRLGTGWGDVTPAVPEPATLALAGLGLAAVLARRAGLKA